MGRHGVTPSYDLVENWISLLPNKIPTNMPVSACQCERCDGHLEAVVAKALEIVQQIVSVSWSASCINSHIRHPATSSHTALSHAWQLTRAYTDSHLASRSFPSTWRASDHAVGGIPQEPAPWHQGLPLCDKTRSMRPICPPGPLRG